MGARSRAGKTAASQKAVGNDLRKCECIRISFSVRWNRGRSSAGPTTGYSRVNNRASWPAHPSEDLPPTNRKVKLLGKAKRYLLDSDRQARFLQDERIFFGRGKGEKRNRAGFLDARFPRLPGVGYAATYPALFLSQSSSGRISVMTGSASSP